MTFEDINELKPTDFQQYKEFTLKYYPIWITNCIQSAEYFMKKQKFDEAKKYIDRGFKYIAELNELQQAL